MKDHMYSLSAQTEYTFSSLLFSVTRLCQHFHLSRSQSSQSLSEIPIILLCELGVYSKNVIISSPQSLLLKIMSEGPTTVGIFRRSPNARAMRELRERLDGAEEV